jgi:hypothetical protein
VNEIEGNLIGRTCIRGTYTNLFQEPEDERSVEDLIIVWRATLKEY